MVGRPAHAPILSQIAAFLLLTLFATPLGAQQSGRLLWTRGVQVEGVETPAATRVTIGSQGEVIVAAAGLKRTFLVAKFSRDGNLLWKRKYTGATGQVKLLDRDQWDNIYVVTDWSRAQPAIYKLNTAGEILWRTELPRKPGMNGADEALASLDRNTGRLLLCFGTTVGEMPAAVFAFLETDGTLLWTHIRQSEVSSVIPGLAFIDDEGYPIVSSFGGAYSVPDELQKLDPTTGFPIWTLNVHAIRIAPGPAQSYYAMDHQYLYRYGRAGELGWARMLPEEFRTGYLPKIFLKPGQEGKVVLAASKWLGKESVHTGVISLANSGGDFLWTRRYQLGNAKDTEVMAFEIGEGGDFFLAGRAYSNTIPPKVTRAYVARLSSDGNLSWEEWYNHASLGTFGFDSIALDGRTSFAVAGLLITPDGPEIRESYVASYRQ